MVGLGRPCDVGHDVLLQLAGDDLDPSPSLVEGPEGRDVEPGARRFPREPRALPAERRSRLAGSRKTLDAVFEHRPGGGWMRGGEEWQHEDVAIPEHMTAVRTAADATSSDRGLARVADRSHEVEEPEANGPLEVVITLDPDIGVRPPARPGRALLHQEPVESRRLGFVPGLGPRRP